MQSKFLIALHLEVAHHFGERCTAGRTGRLEPPATVGATKTSKMPLINPYQISVHGFLCRYAPQRGASLLPACRQRDGVYMRQFEWSVGHPTYTEDFWFAHPTSNLVAVAESL